MRAKLFIALCALAAMAWAVPVKGAAHFLEQSATQNTSSALPRPIRFRTEPERGLLANVWINGRGPFVFVIDTGAGLNLISSGLVNQMGLATRNVQHTIVGGLSNSRVSSNREATINKFALGDAGNVLPAAQSALIVPNLPQGVDGVLDPTEAFAPRGYSIDLPNRTLSVFDGGSFNSHAQPRAETAVVPWVRISSDNRPFVKLADGRVALIDTGSRFGLAITDRNAVVLGRNGQRVQNETARDIGGGTISYRRVEPTTVSIGELELRRIPTHIIFNGSKGAPVILGRDALYPFKVSFDPARRLIEFVALPIDD